VKLISRIHYITTLILVFLGWALIIAAAAKGSGLPVMVAAFILAMTWSFAEVSLKLK
jgi:hypothetical protein